MISYKLLPLLAASILCSSCASIVDGGSDKSVQLSSNPPGAKVTISNKRGETVQVVNTPARVNLRRHKGFFVGERYKLLFEAPGYYPSDVEVKSVMNGWYLGNLIFGGTIGILIVDPATGALFTLSPREVQRNLVPLNGSLSPEAVAAANARANPAAPVKKRPAATSGR